MKRDPQHLLGLLPRGLVIGTVAGFGGGFMSLGGGTLTIPLLLAWTRLSPFEARGTALAVALFSAGMGSWVYAGDGMVDWQAVLLIALPAMILSPLTARWTEHLKGVRLQQIFGIVVLLGGLALLLRDFLLPQTTITESLRTPYLLAVGIVEGAVAGSVGVSGGPILAPALVLGLGMSQQLAQGCSLAARLPAVIGGLWENITHRHVFWPLLPGLITGSLAGAWLGGEAALALPEQHLRSLFALFLLILGMNYLRGRPATHPETHQ